MSSGYGHCARAITGFGRRSDALAPDTTRTDARLAVELPLSASARILIDDTRAAPRPRAPGPRRSSARVICRLVGVDGQRNG